MTLTVRLSQKLEDALDEFTSTNGVTKSHVVQEALAEYLVRTEPAAVRQTSETYKALKKAGVIGCFRGDGVSATKDVVRQKVLENLKRRRERNGY